MRSAKLAMTIAAFAASFAAPLFSQSPDANQVLAAAREALGGDAKLSAVKSFVATGRTRQVRGNNLVPIEFEINCELPDKYVRKDEFPAQDTDLTTVGFSGDQLIQLPVPAPGRGGPAGAAPAAPAGGGRGGPPRLLIAKQDFARLTLGMFATSFAAYPLTFKYAALGEAPEGKADILDVSGPANFSARFVVQRDTHLPVMLMWQAPAGGRGPGQPPPGGRPGGPPPAAGGPPAAAGGTPAAPPPGAPSGPPAAPPEQRMYFADYRDVDGIKLPFRIRRAVGADTIEETVVDRYRLNVKIDPRKFAGQK